MFHILNVSPNIVLFAIIIIFFISLHAVKIFIKNLTNKDPKEVVIDELIGQSIPLCLYEVAHGIPKDSDDALKFYLIMFVLFRFFDIAKPFPVNYFDKNFKNSFGVIMDDVCAGLYVVLVLVLYWFFEKIFIYMFFFSFYMKKLSQKIVRLLRKKRLKISFAESCTGGLLSSSITSN